MSTKVLAAARCPPNRGLGSALRGRVALCRPLASLASGRNFQPLIRMKSALSLLRLPAALAAFAALVLLVPAAESGKPAAKPADLQVMINVPPTWRPFLEDDIADALFYRLQEVFHRRGYKGALAHLTYAKPEAKDVPTLELNLIEWRIDRVGNAQCTLSAALRTPAGEKDLGLAQGTQIFWSHGNRWSISRRMEKADALEDAANSALREVYEDVAKSKLIAGLEKK